MDLMQLNGLIRKAIHLVTGAQIRVNEEEFEFAVTSVIPGFKVLQYEGLHPLQNLCAAA